MKSKDKQIRDLKDSKSGWKTVAIIFMISFVIMSLLMLHFQNKYEYFEGQLSECQDDVNLTEGLLYYLSFDDDCCQDKIPVWTLKVECFNLRGKWINQENYTEIDKCLYFRDVAESWGCKIIENCEVIE